MKLNEIVAKYEEFLSAPTYGYREEILKIADAYPQEKSLVVDFGDLDEFDGDLAQLLLDQANNSIYAANQAIKRLLPPDKDVDIHFRIKNLPPDAKVEVRNLRSKHLGRFVAVEGLVRKATEVNPKITEAVFQCLRCTATIMEVQEGLFFREPMECYKDQGGCGRTPASTRFKLIAGDGAPMEDEVQTANVDSQKIEIQEFPEGVRGGQMPQRLTVWTEDDVTGQVAPGDRAVFYGILRSTQKRYPAKSTIFRLFLDVNYIDVQETDYEEITITDRDEEEILALSRDPALSWKITNSIAPSIYGLDRIKEAVGLQLFGGLRILLPDENWQRGDIHIYIVGDPGTAKTALLRAAGAIAPRCVKASGKGASGAGLTAAAVKDEFGEGRWTLEAGAMVLADKGLVTTDELDKMSKEDRKYIHDAMEDQEIKVTKAGINATLPTRCSLLAAGNPRHERFDSHSYVADQVNIPPALLSRFDLIFAITDKPKKDKDEMIADRILRTGQAGARAVQAQRLDELPDIDMEAGDAPEPPVPIDLLRKYIAYTKTRVFPVIDGRAKQLLMEFYLGIRSMGEEEGAPIPLTARQLLALQRLTMASARMRLSQVAEVEDAERAMGLMEYYLTKLTNDDGRFDIDAIMTGWPKKEKERMRIVVDIIEALTDVPGNRRDSEFRMVDVVARASSMYGMREAEVKRVVQKLQREMQMIAVVGALDSGVYRIVQRLDI